MDRVVGGSKQVQKESERQKDKRRTQKNKRARENLKHVTAVQHTFSSGP